MRSAQCMLAATLAVITQDAASADVGALSQSPPSGTVVPSPDHHCLDTPDFQMLGCVLSFAGDRSRRTRPMSPLPPHFRVRMCNCAAIPCQYRSNVRSGRARDGGIGIAADRLYPDYRSMAAAESARADGIAVVCIATTNESHHAIARTFLEHGMHVICEKLLTVRLDEALDLYRLASVRHAVFALMHNYSAYAMVHQAFIESIANVYSDVADAIGRRGDSSKGEWAGVGYPTVRDGVFGLRFVEAVVDSHRAGGR